MQEWAYAGFAFALLGAFLSHILAGDPFSKAFPSVVLFALGAGVYFLDSKVI